MNKTQVLAGTLFFITAPLTVYFMLTVGWQVLFIGIAVLILSMGLAGAAE